MCNDAYVNTRPKLEPKAEYRAVTYIFSGGLSDNDEQNIHDSRLPINNI